MRSALHWVRVLGNVGRVLNCCVRMSWDRVRV